MHVHEKNEGEYVVSLHVWIYMYHVHVQHASKKTLQTNIFSHRLNCVVQTVVSQLLYRWKSTVSSPDRR